VNFSAYKNDNFCIKTIAKMTPNSTFLFCTNEKILFSTKHYLYVLIKSLYRLKGNSKGGKPLAVLRGRVQREGENRNSSSLCAFFAILSWHQESMKKRKKIEFF
jgi:hypothetical protein